MNRWELFQAVRTAFLPVYGALVALAVFGASAAAAPAETQPVFSRLAVGCILLAAVSLWVKRNLLRDLLSGQTEVFHGRIAFQEDAGGLRAVLVRYLVVCTEGRPKKFVFFPGLTPLPPQGTTGLLTCPVELRYLPRSFVLVQVAHVNLQAPSAFPPRRSKEWYRQKPQIEAAIRESVRPRACQVWERFWFWEFTVGAAVLALLCGLSLCGY